MLILNNISLFSGFNPVWNETLELRIKVPYVSLIYFSLRDESSLARDPVLALCCIPFNSLTTGKRLRHEFIMMIYFTMK